MPSWGTRDAAGRAHCALGTWGQAGGGAVLAMWVQQTTRLASTNPSFRDRILTPFSQGETNPRQVAQLGFSQDIGLRGHDPPPAPCFLHPPGWGATSYVELLRLIHSCDPAFALLLVLTILYSSITNTQKSSQNISAQFPEVFQSEDPTWTTPTLRSRTLWMSPSVTQAVAHVRTPFFFKAE